MIRWSDHQADGADRFKQTSRLATCSRTLRCQQQQQPNGRHTRSAMLWDRIPAAPIAPTCGQLIKPTNHKDAPMFTSNRIERDCGMYHEFIFHDNQVVAQLLSEDDGSYWFVLSHNHAISRGYKTVAAAKQPLFAVLDNLYR